MVTISVIAFLRLVQKSANPFANSLMELPAAHRVKKE